MATRMVHERVIVLHMGVPAHQNWDLAKAIVFQLYERIIPVSCYGEAMGALYMHLNRWMHERNHTLTDGKDIVLELSMRLVLTVAELCEKLRMFFNFKDDQPHAPPRFSFTNTAITDPHKRVDVPVKQNTTTPVMTLVRDHDSWAVIDMMTTMQCIERDILILSNAAAQ